jgi:hypothetical protein
MKKKVYAIVFILVSTCVMPSYLAIAQESGLEIIAPSSVDEGTPFTVQVTFNDVPLQNVMVEFLGYHNRTDENGNTTWNAPNVIEDTNYYINVTYIGDVYSRVIAVVDVPPEPSTKQLVISAPSSVLQLQEFVVRVTCNGEPVETAGVYLHTAWRFTNATGEAELIAPPVEADTPFLLNASKMGYLPASTIITVMYQEEEPEEEFGSMAGRVSTSSGSAIPDVAVCAVLGTGTATCTSTDTDGMFRISDLLPGEYTVSYQKEGYYVKTTTFNVITNEEADASAVLQLIPEELPEPPEENVTIEEAIESGVMGGQISFKITEPTVEINKTTSANITITPTVDEINRSIILIVDSTQTIGTAIAITIDPSFADSASTIVIQYDGHPIDKADNITDVLNASDDSEPPEYWLVTDSNGLQCIVRIPHFSEHIITISFVKKIVEILGGIQAIALYLAFFSIVCVLLVSPIMGSMLYHTFRSKKK